MTSINEQKTISVDVMDIAFWAAFIIFLGLLAWWILGDSPTLEQISLGLTIFGILLGERAGHKINTIEQNTFKTLELQQKMLERLER